MKRTFLFCLLLTLALLGAYPLIRQTQVGSCIAYALGGLREVSHERTARFLGKVYEDSARCRGGESAVAWRNTPWIDWQRYAAAAGPESRTPGLAGNLGFFSPDIRGINGALLDLEYQRLELLKFNLFDNSGTFDTYMRESHSPSSHVTKIWPELRLPKDHPFYADVGGDGPQLCSGELIRFRTISGICNDITNPLMGSSGQPFARNVDFESTFPELAIDRIATNRHGDRIGLLSPDPQLISQKLLSRPLPGTCDSDDLSKNSIEASCDYQKASHLNLLAAFWIQFITHDWFSHLDEGQNQSAMMAMGCDNHQAANDQSSSTSTKTQPVGCRAADRVDKSLIAEDIPAPTFRIGNNSYMSRAHRTTANKVTAWWDASQIYGYDETSRRRVKRDRHDRAKLLLEPAGREARENTHYLPILNSGDPMNPQWSGQEAVAFPDNWNIGLSFFHNVFAREHNIFVDAFRFAAKNNPDADSGLRRPGQADKVISNKDVSADELFEVARLVVAAEIAKIHTIEWTTQLLYNEPVYLAMNANWSGLFDEHPLVNAALERVIQRVIRSGKKSSGWYAAFAAGPGIVGLGNTQADVNAGVNHFGSPFNFPEEFINAYRLHPMLPDFIEFRELNGNRNIIKSKIAVAETVRGKATQAMHQHGPANWALSLGRQRLGKLTLRNHPRFLQSLSMPRLKSGSGQIDVAALDLIRDRERGIPRYNEYRRQYGLKQLTKFDDFIDPRQAKNAEQRELVKLLREIYGQHRCDSSKIITTAQKNDDGSEINDCLGHPNDSLVDNIEDVDAMVGWLAEFARPHGFAISETQFHVFILNASRRLFSDRFLTSSFRPAFYTNLGYNWVNNNGPGGKIFEPEKANGHIVEVSPLKRVLQRTISELREELEPVVNVFDPWARDRGEYYSLEWKPRRGAEADPAFNDK
ncbi:MAG TPA: peroxidase family protein [Candidatus Polarisedimenticolaceae bacterium]|nr:peroxidase family protein [Candidatus Polarisedimenticolaceae bacterium]